MTVLTPTQGTYVRKYKPGNSFYASSKAQLLANNAAGDAKGASYLWFKLPTLTGLSVPTGLLRLHANPDFTGTVIVQRHDANRPYSTLTWNNQPAVLPGSTPVTFTHLGGGIYEADISADLNAIAAGGANKGFVITTTDTSWRYFDGWQSRTNPPTLTFEVSELPPAPTNLSPAGGSVSKSTFVAQWTPDDSATAARVLVDVAGGTFATPIFDSGWDTTAGPLGQLDLAVAGWTGMAVGPGVTWKVEQRNALGDSPFSSPVTVPRVAAPTLAFVSPTGTSGDPTPLRQWTVTGGTETDFELDVFKPDGTPWWQSFKRGGTDLTLTPEKGPTVDGSAVTDRLRVWYDDTRVAAVGDPKYVELVHTWTLDLDGAAAPVAWATATQVGASPLVRVQFRDPIGVADEYLLSRDGQIVERFDGATHEVGTLVWSLLDFTCPPNRRLTRYCIQRGTGGVFGERFEFGVDLTVEGVWLADPISGEMFCVAGDAPQVAYGSASQTNTMLSGREATYTFGLPGYRGTAGGNVQEYDGRTREEQLATAYAMLAAPERDYRMIWADLNIPVRVRDLNPAPNNDSFTDDIAYDVGWTLSQTGELPFAVTL